MQPLSLAMATAIIAGLSFPLAAQSGAGAPYGARDPIACPKVVQAQPPSAQQAALLIRCKRETVNSGSGELWLMENTRVEVGGPQPYAALYNTLTMADADVSKPVYPVRGSWTWATCISTRDAGSGGRNASLNCRETDVGDATGACWQTTFGDWACTMNGRSGATRQGTRAPR